MSGAAVGVFDAVPTLMTLLARARREAASSLTVVYLRHAARAGVGCDGGEAGDADETATPWMSPPPPPPPLRLKLLHHAAGRGFRRPYVLLKRRARPVRLLVDGAR